MAKANGLTAIDKYVEKAIAAVCGLIFVYALFQWGFASPVEFGRGGDKMPPAQIDSYLKSQAEAVKRRVDEFRPTDGSKTDYVAAMTALSKNASGDKYVQAFDLSNARQTIEVDAPKRKEAIALTELQAAIPAPLDKPRVKAAWVLPQKENATEVCVVNGIIAYPYNDLIKQWNEKFHTALNVIFAEQVVEIQEQNPDGSWGAARQAKLQPTTPVDTAGNALVVPTELPAYDGRNAPDVQASLDVLASDTYQQLILQPDYPAVYWARPSQWVSWRVNLPASQLSEGIAQAQGTPVDTTAFTLISSGTAAGVVPATPPVVVAAPVAKPAAPPAAAPGGGDGIMFIPPEAKAAMAARAAAPPAAAPGGGDGIMFIPPEAKAAMAARPAARPAAAPAGPTPPPVAAPVVPAINPSLPSMSTEPLYITQRDDKGQILAWFSDSSLEGGKTYRFRVRFKMANPLLTSDSEAKDPQDARTPFIYTPWSQWSAPVATPPAAQIFLSGASMNSAQVTIFTRVFGQVVKQVGGVLPGDAVGREEDVKVANPIAARMEQKKVNFGTGCVVVAINFDKPVYRGSSLKKTMEMVYLDANGQLQTRLQDADKDSKLYKELLELSTPAPADAALGGSANMPGR
jgi:hypothetical protein